MSHYDPSNTHLDPNLLRIAAHEAGHAIVGVLNGGEVHEIKIYPASEGYAGVTRIKFADELLNELLIGLCAGHEAETLWSMRHLGYSRSKAFRSTKDGCHTDMALVRKYRRRDDNALTEIAARGRAHSLLIQHWPRVERLTDRLARARRLTTAGV